MIMSLPVWLIGKRHKKARNIAAAAVTLLELAMATALLWMPDMNASIGGVAGLGIRLETDGFRKVYLIVIAFLWSMTMLLGNEYFSHYETCNRYYFFNLMTLGATVGVFLAADLFTALIFFEIMSFTSYTWVIQEETDSAIKAANTYLAVAVIGGLAALMGIFLLQDQLHTTAISELYNAAKAAPEKGCLYIAGACILFGFGAKAGMFPLHIWLPKAHPVAPAPASALLSGLLTKSGIFGILVLSCNLFRNDPVWGSVILCLGLITMLLGALLALFSIDLKRTLACSSVSQIGFILTGIGMMGLLGEENALAARGTLLHMLNHSLFKLVLFMSAAVVYMNLHQLDLNDIRGFGRKKPLLMIPFLLGAAGIGGVPLLNGYVSKTLLHESIVEFTEILYESGSPTFFMHAAEWIFLISGGITVAYMTKLFAALFVEKHPSRQAEFDARTKYMNPVSTFALLISAIALPALGVTANISMNAIADLGTDFFRASALEHSVHYLSWENLRGGLISILIGAALYFGVVRTVLIRKKDGGSEYVNLWPAWLDLEELLYRPLLLKWLPGLLGPTAALFGQNRLTAPAANAVVKAGEKTAMLFGENQLTAPAAKAVVRAGEETAKLFGENRISGPAASALVRIQEIASHAFSDLLDAAVFLLRKIVFKKLIPPDADGERNTLSYRIGRSIDRIAVRQGTEKEGERRYANLLHRGTKTLKDTTRSISGTLSFALLFLVLAITAVFIYIIIMRG